VSLETTLADRFSQPSILQRCSEILCRRTRLLSVTSAVAPTEPRGDTAASAVRPEAVQALLLPGPATAATAAAAASVDALLLWGSKGVKAAAEAPLEESVEVSADGEDVAWGLGAGGALGRNRVDETIARMVAREITVVMADITKVQGLEWV
jgi:hypothetical protein